jgi:hypothetical protein
MATQHYGSQPPQINQGPPVERVEHPIASNAANAAAVGAGAAALGAVVGLALTTGVGVAGPIVGAIVAGAIGATGGTATNAVVSWFRHGPRDTSANSH